MFRESFYHFLMTLRQPNQPTEIEQFANNAFLTRRFLSNPKILMKYLTTWKKMPNICQE